MINAAIPRDLPAYSSPPISANQVKACIISEACRRNTQPEPGRPVGPQVCANNDLDCIFTQDHSLKGNTYFGNDCLLEECTDPEQRREFLRQYLRVCTEVKKYTITKADFPPAWIRFAPPNLGEDAVPVISTSSAPSSTTAPSTSLSNSKKGSPATMTSPESPSAVGSAQTASTSSWSEIQKPVCNITPHSLKDPNNASCKLTDLECVCKLSSSITNNTYFKQATLFDDCYSNLGRDEWMNAFAYACDKNNKPIVDITKEWAAHVPAWYNKKYFPSSTSVSPTAAPTQVIVTSKPIPKGVIAGAAIGGVLLIAVIIWAIWAILKKDKKIKAKNKELAISNDRHHPGGGFTGAIEKLNSNDDSPHGAPHGHYGHELKEYGNDASRVSDESIGTTAVDSRMMHQFEVASLITPHNPNPTAPSSVYDDDIKHRERTPSEIAHWDAGYHPPIRSPQRSPPPRSQPTPSPPYRPYRHDEYPYNRDDDEIRPMDAPPRRSLHEICGSPVYNERGVKTSSGNWKSVSPVQTASHTSPVYDVHGNVNGWRQPANF